MSSGGVKKLFYSGHGQEEQPAVILLARVRAVACSLPFFAISMKARKLCWRVFGLEHFFFENALTDASASGARANEEQAKFTFAACSECSVSKLICFSEEACMTSTPKALVIGGRSGLLGQALMDALGRSRWYAVPLGRQDGNLLDVNFLARKIQRIAPDLIFNTLAWTQVDLAEEKPAEAMAVNRGFVSSLTHSIRGTSIRLVHYSTDFVFNGKKQTPYTTEDSPKPESVYGVTKLAGEQALASLPASQYCIVRTAWLFGPGRKNFVETILQACCKRDSLEVVHDQIGSPTYTRDLALWSLKLAELEAGGVFHAVNAGQASWCDLACEAINLAEGVCRVSPISSAQWPQKAKRPPFSVLDTSRLTEVTGLVPRPWPLALREYVYREYLPGH